MSACNPAALLEKYVEMLALRTLDAEDALADPKPRMRALATRFPGALREIDELPLETIQSRIRSLEKTTQERGEPAEWMLAMARFHDAMREVLAIKRIIGRRKLTPALRKKAERIAKGWAIERISKPPNGRLVDLVFERVAAEMKITTKRARALVFP